MFQMMHCRPITSCFIKTQNGLTFWCQLTQVVLEKRPLNRCLCLIHRVNDYGVLYAVRLVLVLVQLLSSMRLSRENYSWLIVACGVVKLSAEMTSKVSIC